MRKNKKALSQIVAYVLLIVIAVSLSLVIYAWMKNQIPKRSAECPDSVSLIINNYECENPGELVVLFKNKGLFDIDATIVRARMKDETLFSVLKDENDFAEHFFSPVLGPGEEQPIQFSYLVGGDLDEVEIQPILIIDEEVVLCDKAIIRQDLVEC